MEISGKAHRFGRDIDTEGLERHAFKEFINGQNQFNRRYD